MSELSPLSGVKRKSDFGAVRAAFDPERKSAREGCVRSRPSPVNHGCRISDIHRRDAAATPPSALTYLKHPHVLSGFPSLLDSVLIVTRPKLARRSGSMRDFRSAIASALMTLTIWTATATPSQASTGTAHVLFSKAGVIAAVGSGTR